MSFMFEKEERKNRKKGDRETGKEGEKREKGRKRKREQSVILSLIKVDCYKSIL